MMYKTHLIFALFIYLILAKYLAFSKSFWILLIVGIGSLLPDIDSSQSFINRTFKISKVFALTSKHRGFWHSIFGLILVATLTYLICLFLHLSFSFVLAISIGYFLHLAADALTVSGIKPLWKISNFEIKGFFKTSSILEMILFFILLFLSLYLLKPEWFNNLIGFLIKLFNNK